MASNSRQAFDGEDTAANAKVESDLFCQSLLLAFETRRFVFEHSKNGYLSMKFMGILLSEKMDRVWDATNNNGDHRGVSGNL